MKSLRDPLKWIGCYQIGGALLGTEVLQRQFATFLHAGPIGWFFLLVVTSFFTLNGIAGVLLLRGAPVGSTLTVIAQVLQVPSIDVPGLLYYAISGVSFAMNWQQDWFGFTTSLGSQFSLFVRHVPEGGSRFAVNLVPLVLLYLVRRARTRPATLSSRLTSA